MGLLFLQNANFEEVFSLSSFERLAEFNDELGQFLGQQHLTIDPNVKPMIMPNRRVPIAVRDRLKEELDQFTEIGVIAPVTEHTSWSRQRSFNSKALNCLVPFLVLSLFMMTLSFKYANDKNITFILRSLLSCENYGVRLDKDKFELAFGKINIMGHVISSDGIRTDPEKYRAIRDFHQPTFLNEVRHFPGVVQYLPAIFLI
ncbi:retrovirus-related pol polyprotein from transposon 17.6 [Plakobranchus ocellatus]|uniref:Retrovirus-related pol polyprotein from transposon 17.6 n=1 Tax=Plakobranchus ocellatus TaxID=259542 RepID=A0AAV4DWF1_9GAST|nr:retrovirus-related pol polyprotein from transposon 17.6 [Plakobranchus ocellatus]